MSFVCIVCNKSYLSNRKTEVCLNCEGTLEHKIVKLEFQNKKLVEALRFYASGDAHDSNDSWIEYYDNGHTRFATGKRARAVLKEVGANL